MTVKSLTAAALAVVALATATPSFAQGIEIGRDGVRLVDPNARQGDMRRDDRRAGREINERDAVRIARGEGVREVDEVRRQTGPDGARDVRQAQERRRVTARHPRHCGEVEVQPVERVAYRLRHRQHRPAERTIELDGVSYPYVTLDISSYSHPFYTGRQKTFATEGSAARFKQRFGRFFANTTQESK